MERERFLKTVREGLSSIREGRLFDTERGYQGALIAQLEARLSQFPIWPGNPLVEQEYQKTIERHGLTLRPDIIVHLPFDRGGMRRLFDLGFRMAQGGYPWKKAPVGFEPP